MKWNWNHCLPKKLTKQPKQQGRSTEKPTRIESIRNILTCPVVTHVGKLWRKRISHPRSGGGVTGSKWCFPEPSQRTSWACPQAVTSCPHSQPPQQPVSPGQPRHEGSLCLSSVPVHHPQPSSFSKGGWPPWQYETHSPQLSPVQVAWGMCWFIGQDQSINKQRGITYRAEARVFHNTNE